MHSFCLGSDDQPPLGTLAIIKDAVSTHKIRRVFIDCDIYQVHKKDTPYWQKKPSTIKMFTYRYLKNEKAKWEYIFADISPEYWFNAAFPIVKVKNSLDILPKCVYRLAKKKLRGNYFILTPYEAKYYIYGGQGCTMSKNIVAENSMVVVQEFAVYPDEISQEWVRSIDKIIAFCKKNGVECTFYSAPKNICHTVWFKDHYEDFYAWYKHFFEERGYEYWDFSLFKTFDTREHNFYNMAHLNKDGILEFTRAFADFLITNGTAEKSTLFYPTYSAMLSNERARVAGLYFDESRKDILQFKAVSVNCDEALITFDITILEDGQATRVFKNTTNTSVPIPKSSGKIIIDTKYCGNKQGHFEKSYSHKMK